MLAVTWPFGCPPRFTDFGGAQTRYAQTVRAFSPKSAALLGLVTRPGSPSPFASVGRGKYEGRNGEGMRDGTANIPLNSWPESGC